MTLSPLHSHVHPLSAEPAEAWSCNFVVCLFVYLFVCPVLNGLVFVGGCTDLRNDAGDTLLVNALAHPLVLQMVRCVPSADQN